MHTRLLLSTQHIFHNNNRYETWLLVELDQLLGVDTLPPSDRPKFHFVLDNMNHAPTGKEMELKKRVSAAKEHLLVVSRFASGTTRQSVFDIVKDVKQSFRRDNGGLEDVFLRVPFFSFLSPRTSTRSTKHVSYTDDLFCEGCVSEKHWI